MNTLKTIFGSLSLLLSFTVSAQKKDAASDIPYSNRIAVSDNALEKLFQSGEHVTVDLAPGFHIDGTLQNKTDHGNNITSLLIRVSNRQESTMSISKYTDSTGHTVYSGRLMKLHSPDGMMLIAKDDRYYFIETQQRYLVAE